MSSEPYAHVDLHGLTVAITGAASGIGRALAEGFRSDGATVVGGDLPSNLDALAEVCDVGVPVDVTSAADNERLVAAAVEVGGRLDAFVANAGIAVGGRFEDLAWEQIDSVLRVNLDGVLHGMRAALAVMRPQGSGRIVVTASRNAETCHRGMLSYNASKAAVIVAVRTLAKELRGVDICVNNLIPGVSATGIWGSDEATPDIARDPALAYPTARFLATLPPGGPTGETWFDMERLTMWKDFDA
jgi:NAD(P)-dependent dehydrogenase (short-subunit alcohol dehydrogenase family)